MSYDCVVVGGGIVGAAAAHHLVHEGARVLLVDREDEGRATSAGAGILSPDTYRGSSEAWFRFAIHAFEYIENLVADLAASGLETGFSRCGALVVAVDDDEIEPFAAAREIIFGNQRRRGAPAAEDLRELSTREARDLFPPLAEVGGAIHNARAARVDGRLLESALRTTAVKQGLEVHDGSVEKLILAERRVSGVRLEAGEVEAANVLISGGAWSESFAKSLGVGIPVAPQRGQIIHLDVGNDRTGEWPMVSAFRDHYIVPWTGGRVAVGATRETGAGFEPRTTATGIREVLDEAMRVAPGLAEASVSEIRVGLRPLSADGLPLLGPVPGVAGVFLATGHGASGLQLGPISGRIVADMVLGLPLAVDTEAFKIERFG